MDYKRTVQSCYLSYVSHAVINGLPALLFTVLVNRYGLGYERLGRLVLINFVTHLAVDALAVRLADKIGYRRCLVGGHAMAALGLALFGLLPGWLPRELTYAGLCFAVAVFSVGGGFIQCLVSPVIGQINVSAGAMTLLHSFYPWGVVVTTLLSTIALRLLPEELWYVLPLAWTVVPLLTMAGFATSPMAEPRMSEAPSQSLKELARSPGFWLFVGMMSFAGATEASMGQWRSLFAEQGIGVSKLVGDLLGTCVSAVIMAVIRMTCGRWERHIPLEKFLVFACGGSAACFALAALLKNPAFALAALTLSGVAIAMLWPGTVHRGAKGFPRGGTALFGMLAAGGDFGCSLGPWLLGVVSDQAGRRYGNQMGLRTGMLAGAAFPLGFLALLVMERRGQKRLTNTEYLALEEKQITDLAQLSSLTHLKTLLLCHNKITDVTPIHTLTALKTLSFWDNQVADLTPLSGLVNLTELGLGNNNITDLTPMRTLTGLIETDLEHNNIENVAPLQTLINLKKLYLSDNQIKDIAPLRALVNLTELGLYENQITDVTPLYALTNLSKLELRGNPLTGAQIDELRRALPNCEILI